MLRVINKVFCMTTSLRGDFSLFMLRNIYFEKFQCVIRCGIIVLGGEIESVQVLKIQKEGIIRLKGLTKDSLAGKFFKELKTITVKVLYIFEVLCYIRKNNIYLRMNLNMYEYNTRRKCVFHVLSCVTSLFKKCDKYGN
jgi:hypothetical protein